MTSPAQPERQLALPSAAAGVLRLPWPSALHAGLLLHQRTLLVAEVWEATGGAAEEQLVGVVKIPLQLPAEVQRRKSRGIVILRFGTARQKMALNDGQIQNPSARL